MSLSSTQESHVSILRIGFLTGRAKGCRHPLANACANPSMDIQRSIDIQRSLAVSIVNYCDFSLKKDKTVVLFKLSS